MKTPLQTKKILFAITKSNWGGAQRYVFDLATRMPKQWEAVVVLGGFGTLKEKLDEAGIRTVSLETMERDIHILDEIKYFFVFLKILFHERPHVLHVNSSKIGGIGSLAGRLYNILPKGNPFAKESYADKTRVIFTAHGWAFNEERAPWARITIKILSWFTLLFAHTTITVSEKDRDQALDMPFINSRKVSLIHNGVRSISFLAKEKAREALIPKYKEVLPRGTVWVGSVGELTKNKGFPYAINAIATVNAHTDGPGFAYTILGDGEDMYALTNMIERADLKSSVRIVSIPEDAARFLHAFDIFLIPSIKEGLPYVLLEAGAAKLPTIATNVGGIPDVITDMDSGVLVRAKDEGEIERALLFLKENKKKRAHYAENLQKHIRATYGIDRMITRTQTLYTAR